MRWIREELTYCSNVHPGASLNEVFANISNKLSPVAKQRNVPTMASGLWFANNSAEQLSNHSQDCEQLFAQLAHHKLYIGTLNGFPFGDFHQKIVKQKVYLPTWADSDRLDYTLKLAHMFSKADSPGLKEKSISTLPLGYARNWTLEQHQQATNHLCKLTKELQEIERSTGQHIRVCLEMEPDCVLENTDQLIYFFNNDLEHAAKHLNIDTALIYRYLGCCFDTCHQAVMHESIFDSMKKITQANIIIGKIQISNAPTAIINNRQDLLSLLNHFHEPKFLHQVKIKSPSGNVIGLPDLTDSIVPPASMHSKSDQISSHADYATQNLSQYYGCPWHVHFHVPIYMEQLHFNGSEDTVLKTKDTALKTADTVIGTTQKSIIEVFEFIATHQDRLHTKPFLEVETYTWSQFQKSKNFNLLNGIVAELDWLEQQLSRFDLLTNESHQEIKT